MNIRVPTPSQPVRVVMQRVGYSEWRDPRSGDVSYARRLGPFVFPKFHCYVEISGTSMILKLHLDQKQPSYAGVTKHSGEYEGATVETEGHRIEQILKS